MSALSKLGIFFAVSLGAFAAIICVYISKFGTLFGSDDLMEILALGSKLDVLSKDGKFFYTPTEQPFQTKLFVQTNGVFAAGDKGTYPTVYYGKQKWVRVSSIDDDLFKKPAETKAESSVTNPEAAVDAPSEENKDDPEKDEESSQE